MRVLLVDDEGPARRRLRALLEAAPDVTVVGEAGDGAEAIEAIERLAPDLVCLDVAMPELDGIGVVAALPPESLPLIIFVTAYDHYAVRAFDAHAVDYVMKPVSRERLLTAIERARERFSSGRSDRAALAQLIHDAQPPFPDRIAIRAGGRTRILPVKTIQWIEAAGSYVTVVSNDGKALIRSSMNQMEARLAPDMFVRVHRSVIVNVKRIAELRSGANRGDGILVLDTGQELPLSRSYRERLTGLIAEL